MDIIDDYLDYKSFISIKSLLLGLDFPWFFRNSQVSFDNKNYTEYFTHSFYNNKINSDDWNIIKPLVNKLNVKSLIEVRANLITQKHDFIQSEYHTDNNLNCKTAIFYVNTCNGLTKFKDDVHVNCKENRLIMFDSNMLHAGVSQTDTKQRVVININYEV